MAMAATKDKSRAETGRLIQGLRSVALALALFAFVSLAYAVPKPQSTTADSPASGPIEAETGFLQSQGAFPRFQSAGKVSGDALTATLQQRVASVPYFAGSFAFEGRTFPFTLVGKSPQAGGATQIPTQVITVSVLFQGFVDGQGNPIVLDADAVLPNVEASPIFRNASYQSVGLTQFADAVQRAQFFHAMAPDWHTLLGSPELLKPVTIVVPRGMGRVYRNRSLGSTFAVVDTSFFISQLNTIMQLENLHSDSLALVLTNNVFLATASDPKQCCVLGFHTSFVTRDSDRSPEVQTMVWASWIDPGLLGSGAADITPISHEISEWMNNPFGTNIVPPWQALGRSGGCQNNLETADPVAALPNAAYPVIIDGVTYHPQTQVLLPWFTRQGTGNTLDGSYSFPDQTLVTGVSQSCTMR